MSGIFNEQLTFKQENGPDVRLVVKGDEHYAHYETVAGYTVIYDEAQGLFCYAETQNGRFVSTGLPMSEQPPPQLRRHITESEEVRQEKFAARHTVRRPPAAVSAAAGGGLLTLGENGGLLPGRRVSSGVVRGLTIIVDFQDVTTTITKQDVEEMLNGDNFTRNGNFCSARKYFLTVSNGKLDYTNVVVGPVKLSRKQQFYVTNSLVPEAMQLAVNTGIDLTQFDSIGDGIIDAVNFLYAGQSRYEDELWPHNGERPMQVGNMRTHFYLLTGLGRTPADLTIGTFCHENGHLLCRFPDMYDYGNRDGDGFESAGIGAYCLMGAGNHLNNGRTPAPVCGYLRELVGWADVVELSQPGEKTVTHGDYGTVLKYPTDKLNEYFIIENRTKMNLDLHLPSSGLAVYHCDTKGSNEFQEGSSTRHYQCALLQADGRRDLENNQNRGDGGDLFGAISGTALSDVTAPSSRQWDARDSRLIVSQISEPDREIKFRVGPEVVGQVVIQEIQPGLTIPDNNPAGISSKLALNSPGLTRRIRTGVGITHTFIGDLQVELVSPSGDKALIYDRKDGEQDDLKQTFDSSTNTALKALLGKPVSGDWELRVRDIAGQDQGKLDSWRLEVELDGLGSQVEQHEIEPNIDIPDATPVGVSSTLAFTNQGTARQIKLNVAIDHTFRGDLRVELFSPSGRRALLHAESGDDADNLSLVLDSNSPSSPLQPLVGQPVTGNWVLRVADLVAQDVGKLKKWSLELTPQF
jgi:M6 family metalloprotease-like protein